MNPLVNPPAIPPLNDDDEPPEHDTCDDPLEPLHFSPLDERLDCPEKLSVVVIENVLLCLPCQHSSANLLQRSHRLFVELRFFCVDEFVDDCGYQRHQGVDCYNLLEVVASPEALVDVLGFHLPPLISKGFDNLDFVYHFILLFYGLFSGVCFLWVGACSHDSEPSKVCLGCVLLGCVSFSQSSLEGEIHTHNADSERIS